MPKIVIVCHGAYGHTQKAFGQRVAEATAKFVR